MQEFINSLGKDGLKSAYNLIQHFALYLTIAITVILAVSFVLIKLRANEKLSSFKTLALGVTIGYAVTLSAIVVFLMIVRMNLKAELDVNYFLLLGLFVVLIVYALSALITSLISEKAFKIVNLVGLTFSIAYGIVLACILPTVSEEYQPLSTIGMYVFSAVLVVVIATLTILTGKYTGSANKTKTIAYASICIALSYALSFVKFFTMGANGGSITFASLLPLMIFAYCFGAKKGLFAGVIYGVLQFLQSPQVYQGMQVLLDYPIAFGAIGLAGIFKNARFTKNEFVKFALGAFVAVLLRYIAHVLSGYYVFSSWAWEGYGALAYSVVYNLFCFVDLAIVLIPAFGIFSSKTVLNELKKISE